MLLFSRRTRQLSGGHFDSVVKLPRLFYEIFFLINYKLKWIGNNYYIDTDDYYDDDSDSMILDISDIGDNQ